MTSERAVWQISAGPAPRSYADIFLRYGVGLIGPGDAGPWRLDRGDDEFEGGFVRRFASEVQVGDAVLLRTGLSRIRAVGLVTSDYLYLNAFDDVNGWDLQHARRVRWSELPTEYDFGAPIFGANPPRFSGVGHPDVATYVYRYLESPPIAWQDAPLPRLPEEEPLLDEVPRNLQGLVAEVNDLYPLMLERGRFGELPSEDEVIVHFVVPLLRALGWPPERIAVKWRYIDIALFTALPRGPESCYLVIEAKRIGAPVEGALAQARGYVASLGVPRDIVVTDGFRYRMYSCAKDFQPVAYANLVRLKRSAVELLERMRRP
jgi:hypothetical protein